MIAVNPRSEHYPALDGLRGIAILLVVFFHNFGFIKYFNFGWLGVDLFFVLSGFLITNILMKEVGSKNYLKNFYVRRILRIFPLYYLFLIVFLLILPNFEAYKDNLKYYTDNQWWIWTYLQNWLYVFKLPEDTNLLLHLWSLGVEEQYYLIWPFVILLIRKPKWLLLLSLTILVLIMGIRFILWYKNIEGFHYFTLYTFTRIDGLCIGSALALIRILKPNFITYFTAPVILFVAVLNFIFYFVNKTNNYSFPYFAIVGYTTFAVVFAILVHEAATSNKNIITKILSIAALRFLGKISYGFYIFHWPVFIFLSPIFTNFLSNYFEIDYLIIQITSSFIATLTGLVISIASFYFFEIRFLKLKKHFI